MAEIVNLNRVKKAKAKVEDQAKAVANRAKHGRTTVERARDTREDAQRNVLLDGARKDS